MYVTGESPLGHVIEPKQVRVKVVDGKALRATFGCQSLGHLPAGRDRFGFTSRRACCMKSVVGWHA